MKIKDKFRVGMKLAGFLPLAFLGGCSEEQPEVPNVVFFLVDDLGWTDLGCYGSSFYETPNIDRLATEGVRFTNSYSACHVCSPTRASILTGKYPASIDMTDWLPGRREYAFQRFSNAPINQHLPYEEITLAEALRDQGYATGIFGKWHLGEDPSNPEAHGFDVHIPNWAKGWPNSGYHSPFKMEGIPDQEGAYLTDMLTDAALQFIETRKDQPFFLYLSHYAVHDPIEGRADLVEKYEKKLLQMQAQQGPAFILEGNPDGDHNFSREQALSALNMPEFQGYSQLPNNMVKIKQFQDNVQFAAMVESVDESIGRILEKLTDLGLDKNTIVIFVSDNGGMSAANFGNPNRILNVNQLDKAFATSNLPLRGAKGFLYEGGIRVPMIVKWPGKTEQGFECDVPVISPDFYPSIMEMLSLQVPQTQEVDGVSFVPLLQGAKSLDRDAIFWHFPHYSNHGGHSPGGAIRQGDYKLLEYFENNTVQLFNLKDDLGEQHDLSASMPQKVEQMRDQLHQWRVRVDAKMLGPNPMYQTQ